MEISPKVKQWLIGNHGLAKDASDDDAKKLLAAKYVAGEITDADIKAANSSGAQEKVGELAETIAAKTAEATAAAVSSSIGSQFDRLIDAIGTKEASSTSYGVEVEKEEEEFEKSFEDLEGEELEAHPVYKRMAASLAKGMRERRESNPQLDDYSVLKAGLDADDSNPVRTRVKQVKERYHDVKTASKHGDIGWHNCPSGRPTHPLHGKELSHLGRELTSWVATLFCVRSTSGTLSTTSFTPRSSMCLTPRATQRHAC
jgi:hypothetical protein